MNSPLETIVEVFIRIQFWRVGWQVEYFDFPLVLFQPCLNYFAVVDFQVVQDKKHFASGILYQSAHELDQPLTVHVVAVEHKPNLALIGDGRDHVDPFTLCGLSDNWCLALE